MRVQYRIGTGCVAAAPRAPRSVPPVPLLPLVASPGPAPRDGSALRRHVAVDKLWLVPGAVAAAALLAVAGCSAIDPITAKAWRIEPVLEVKHSIAASQGHYLTGRYHDGMRAWDKAIDSYRKAINADARNVEAYNALGVALAQRGPYADSEAALRKALEIDPNRAHVRSNLGYVLMLAGQPREAVTELKAAVRLDHNNVVSLGNLREAVAQVELAQATLAPAQIAAHAMSTPQNTATNAPAGFAAGNATQNAVAVLVVEQHRAEGTVAPALPVIASVPAPMSAAVSVPAPTADTTPAMPVLAAAPTILVSVSAVPGRAALQVIDRPTLPAMQSAHAVLQAEPPTATAPTPSATTAHAGEHRDAVLEVSNGNGINGMGARVREWLARQGVRTHQLSNQRPYVQEQTLVQYRSGHEEAAQRVARALPGSLQLVPTPSQGLRTDVRLVLGRDWARTAACLERNMCQSASTKVAGLNR